jgi:hypothetical protein
MKPRTVEAREAQARGEVKFESERPCCRCDGVIFYSAFRKRATPKCVSCSTERSAKYGAENKEKMKELNANWYQKNKPYVAARSRAYYEEHRPSIIKRNADRTQRIRKEKNLAELINNS